MANFLSILMLIGLLLWAFKITPKSTTKKPLNPNEIYAEFKKEMPWLKDPLPPDDEEEKAITVKSPSFDVSKIKSYEGGDITQFEFRPKNFLEFVGQEQAKEDLKTIIKMVKRQMVSHLLLKGIQGHGKTSLIYVFKNELEKALSYQVKLIERIGKQIDEINLPILIQKEINEAPEKYIILFIDETDTMDWKVLKTMNPILESFQIAGKRIKPFIFCGATINFDEILKTNPDTLDRIPNKIKFQRYNAEEIARIITQYKNQLFPQDNVPKQVIEIISKNCKFNPRNSITLLKKFIVEQNINKVLQNSQIIKDGLTVTDIKLLKVLNEVKKSVGAGYLASRVGLKEKQYLREYEPFLVEYNYIDRTPRRELGDKGKEILEKVIAKI